jgi:hypothetical protein
MSAADDDDIEGVRVIHVVVRRRIRKPKYKDARGYG